MTVPHKTTRNRVNQNRKQLKERKRKGAQQCDTGTLAVAKGKRRADDDQIVETGNTEEEHGENVRMTEREGKRRPTMLVVLSVVLPCHQRFFLESNTKERNVEMNEDVERAAARWGEPQHQQSPLHDKDFYVAVI